MAMEAEKSSIRYPAMGILENQRTFSRRRRTSQQGKRLFFDEVLDEIWSLGVGEFFDIFHLESLSRGGY